MLSPPQRWQWTLWSVHSCLEVDYSKGKEIFKAFLTVTVSWIFKQVYIVCLSTYMKDFIDVWIHKISRNSPIKQIRILTFKCRDAYESDAP